MAGIKNLENLSDEQINNELKKGGKFVMFSYTISIIIMTFRRNSDIYFIKSGESAVAYSWKYSLITFLLVGGEFHSVRFFPLHLFTKILPEEKM